jgi:hypothetical protein
MVLSNRIEEIELFLLRFFFAIILGVCLHGVSYAKIQRQDRQSLYFDAGSSGTRVGIFSETYDKEGRVFIKEQYGVSTTSGTGLHKLAKSNLKEVQTYFEPLLKQVETYVGKGKMQELPVYLYATGGVRSLPIEEQKQLFKKVIEYFKNIKKFKKVFAEAPSGEEEGLFGWFMVNYLTGTLQADKNTKTIGVVDVGGATLQIAFEIDPTDKGKYKDTTQIHTGDKVRRIYVHSYPYGQNILLKNTESLRKACLAQHYTKNLEQRLLRCENEILSVFKKTCKNLERCGLGAVEQPKVHGPFVGIGGIVYFARDFGLEDFTYAVLKKKAEEMCSMDDKKVETFLRKGALDDKSAVCFRLNYYLSVLYGSGNTHTGFGIRKEEKFDVLEEIQGVKTISWMVGAVYYNSLR